MSWPSLKDHLSPSRAPKRVLSLDGGGVRGILTLAYLKRIEDLLRARFGNADDFRLCHYFDLIGGTSTGSIIAAGLSLGMTVDQLIKLYRGLAGTVFKKRGFWAGFLDSKFPTQPLQQALEAQFGNICLGGSEILTGLMIMTKRLDTNSPWVIHNHPDSKYFAPAPPSNAFPNKLYSLRQIVRASTAAPHYFEPEKIQVADRLTGAFVDGGVSPHNNPALQLFMLATLSGYCWNWKTGADNLMIISVGTGNAAPRLTTEEVMELSAAELALRALTSLMDDCSAQAETILQWLSRSPTRRHIDSEIGDLANDRLCGHELLTYCRYNLIFDTTWIARNLGAKVEESFIEGMDAMDNPRKVDQLYDLGSLGADKQIEEQHFPAAFDLVRNF
jgi:patatin-like phospholipase/acyl hydrolase